VNKIPPSFNIHNKILQYTLSIYIQYSYCIAGKIGSGKVWEIYSWKILGMKCFGKWIDQAKVSIIALVWQIAYVTQFWKTLHIRTLLDFEKYRFVVLKVV